MGPSARGAKDALAPILTSRRGVALLVGNGINRYANDQDCSWEDLLERISQKRGVKLSKEELSAMSNTERFDILDIAKPMADRSNLKQMFCDLMRGWHHGPHHTRIVTWAQRHAAPIITVNFDDNLSRCVPIRFIRTCGTVDRPRFTDWYPWRSYFGTDPVTDPANAFGIWHAHGMVRYVRSIRLGLTDYMGSVDRARAWMYRGDNSLIRYLQGNSATWRGFHTWLHPFFSSDIAIIGFGFGKDETFLRWLFLERARLFKRFPSRARQAWFVTTDFTSNRHRQPLLNHLGIDLVAVETYDQIFKSPVWDA